MKGFDPLPVFHYQEDEKWLQKYINQDCNYIALGGTVPEKDKNKVAQWINDLSNKYPHTRFHLLGSSSKKITQGTNIYSCDSSTWILMAINGFPKEIPGRSFENKVKRAEWQMKKIMSEIS